MAEIKSFLERQNQSDLLDSFYKAKEAFDKAWYKSLINQDDYEEVTKILNLMIDEIQVKLKRFDIKMIKSN